jgi:hypothetical protein
MVTSLDLLHMAELSDTSKTLTFEQLVELREKTEVISQFLHKRLKVYVETLRLLLAPGRLLGKYVGVKEDVLGADKALAQLRELYRGVCGKPFALSAELDEGPLKLLDNRLELYPWEYTYQAKNERETKAVTITSPVRWILTYSAGYTLSQVLQAVIGKEQRQTDALRQFVVNALVMHLVLAKYPGIVQLLTDLRYQVSIDKSSTLGELPLITLSACLPSFRPSDELLLTAIRFSGVPVFIELIDVAMLDTLHDPLKQHLEKPCR